MTKLFAYGKPNASDLCFPNNDKKLGADIVEEISKSFKVMGSYGQAHVSNENYKLKCLQAWAPTGI